METDSLSLIKTQDQPSTMIQLPGTEGTVEFSPAEPGTNVVLDVPIRVEAKRVRALPPDEQRFDEIHIVTVPRYKTGAGCQWRISTKVQLKRKGQVLFEKSFGSMQQAVACAGSVWYKDVMIILRTSQMTKNVIKRDATRWPLSCTG